MTTYWENFLWEIALFTSLGILYYFYQKRRIIDYEKNKTNLILNEILQLCLNEKNEKSQPELDQVLESLDDYLEKRISDPPLNLLKKFLYSPDCTLELRRIISEGIIEIERDHEKN